MTREEAEEVIRKEQRWWGDVGLRIIPNPRGDGYAIAVPAWPEDEENLWWVIDKYDVTTHEEIDLYLRCPRPSRLDVATAS